MVLHSCRLRYGKGSNEMRGGGDRKNMANGTKIGAEKWKNTGEDRRRVKERKDGRKELFKEMRGCKISKTGENNREKE